MEKNSLRMLTGFVALLVLSFSGCGKKADEKILANINGYEMTVSDFKDEMRYSPYSSEKMADKERMLDVAVRKQILIQEAQRRGLDRNKTFMKTIERYWKQTLVKELLDSEFAKIDKDLPEGEKRDKVRSWMESLSEKADVTIDKTELKKIQEEER